MDREPTNGLMAEFIMDSIRMIRNMASVFISMLMEELI